MILSSQKQFNYDRFWHEKPYVYFNMHLTQRILSSWSIFLLMVKVGYVVTSMSGECMTAFLFESACDIEDYDILYVVITLIQKEFIFC